MPILFAWDFHGVLEKDNDFAVMNTINRIMKEIGCNRKISIDEARMLYGVSWQEYFHYMVPGASEETIKQCLLLSPNIGMEEAQGVIKPNDYSIEVLEKIKNGNHHNIAVSNSSQETIEWFIKAVGLEKFFDKCIGIDSHKYKKEPTDRVSEKALAISEYAKKFPFSKIVVIGDTKEDIEAGRLCGATTYFYNNSFNTHLLVSGQINSDHVIIDLREALKELNN